MSRVFEEKISLLLLAAFHDQGDRYLSKWLSIYNTQDLDRNTQLILPHLPLSCDFESRSESSKFAHALKSYVNRCWIINLSKMRALRNILKVFSIANIPFCLLKGATMLLYYAKNLSLRAPSADIDLLIRKEDIASVVNILISEGYHITDQKNSYQSSLVANILHNSSSYDAFTELHFCNKDGLVIDLHWELHRFMGKIAYEDLSKEMMQVHIMGLKMHILCPEAHLAHTTSHGLLQKDRFQSLNWVLDFCYIVNNVSLDIDRLHKLLEKFKATDYFMLAYKIFLPYCKKNALNLIHKMPKKTTGFHGMCLGYVITSRSNMVRFIYNSFLLLRRYNFNPLYLYCCEKTYSGWGTDRGFIRHLLRKGLKGE